MVPLCQRREGHLARAPLVPVSLSKSCKPQSLWRCRVQNTAIVPNHSSKSGVVVASSSLSEVATNVDSSGELFAPDLPYRIGHGFDLHRLAEGYSLIIGGIDIPHTKGCEAHSDGDVLLHCVVDALLGALGLPDIGQIFPDNDPKWKGASSDIFMKEAVRLMKERGYVVGNVDATLIAQKPKLSPHKENIRRNLCTLLEAHPSVVNLKAKTHEKVDSIGEERSIACHTVVLLIKKELLKPVVD